MIFIVSATVNLVTFLPAFTESIKIFCKWFCYYGNKVPLLVLLLCNNGNKVGCFSPHNKFLEDQ